MARKNMKSRRNRKTRRIRRRQRGGSLLSVSFSNFRASSDLPTRPIVDTQQFPSVTWPDSGSLKMLICWDPDSSQTSWVHWLVINCKGTTPSSGTEVLAWEPPSPPEGTGRHRYFFSLYDQPGPIDIKLTERGSVAVEEMAEEKGLKLLDKVGFRTSAAGPSA